MTEWDLPVVVAGLTPVTSLISQNHILNLLYHGDWGLPVSHPVGSMRILLLLKPGNFRNCEERFCRICWYLCLKDSLSGTTVSDILVMVVWGVGAPRARQNNLKVVKGDSEEEITLSFEIFNYLLPTVTIFKWIWNLLEFFSVFTEHTWRHHRVE